MIHVFPFSIPRWNLNTYETITRFLILKKGIQFCIQICWASYIVGIIVGENVRFLDSIQSRWLRFELVTVTRSYGTPLSEYETELGQGSSWKINDPCRIHKLKHYRIAWQDHRLTQTNYRPSKSIARSTPYFCQFPLSSSFRSILFTFPLSVSIFQFFSRFLRIFYLVIAFSINSMDSLLSAVL